MASINSNYPFYTWSQVREQVKALDSNLAEIIDELNPDGSHHFYKFDYPFGTEIVKKGILNIPDQDRFISLKTAPKELQHQIGYNYLSNPVTFVLKNTTELFLNVPDRVIPISIAKPGSLFGLSIVLDKNTPYYPELNLWGLTAGARSIFFLPKVSLGPAHQKLRKKYKSTANVPSSLLEHWSVFKDIAENSIQENKWETSLLFFNKRWFEHEQDPAWAKFLFYLQNKFIKGTSYHRNEYLFKLIYSQIHHKYGQNPSHYISDTARYLIQVALGALPGFMPASNSSCAPIDTIQEAYMDYYKLSYAPIIMQPGYLENNSLPVYASLQHNGTIDLNKKSSSRKSVLTDLIELHQLMNQYQYSLNHWYKNIELHDSTLTSIGTNFQYNYFHGHDVDDYANILSTQQLPEIDPRFAENTFGKPFPYKAHFLNGCIQINYK